MRHLIIILALSMFAITGCGDKKDDNNQPAQPAASEAPNADEKQSDSISKLIKEEILNPISSPPIVGDSAKIVEENQDPLKENDVVKAEPSPAAPVTSPMVVTHEAEPVEVIEVLPVQAEMRQAMPDVTVPVKGSDYEEFGVIKDASVVALLKQLMHRENYKRAQAKEKLDRMKIDYRYYTDELMQIFQGHPSYRHASVANVPFVEEKIYAMGANAIRVIPFLFSVARDIRGEDFQTDRVNNILRMLSHIGKYSANKKAVGHFMLEFLVMKHKSFQMLTKYWDMAQKHIVALGAEENLGGLVSIASNNQTDVRVVQKVLTIISTLESLDIDSQAYLASHLVKVLNRDLSGFRIGQMHRNNIMSQVKNIFQKLISSKVALEALNNTSFSQSLVKDQTDAIMTIYMLNSQGTSLEVLGTFFINFLKSDDIEVVNQATANYKILMGNDIRSFSVHVRSVMALVVDASLSTQHKTAAMTFAAELSNEETKSEVQKMLIGNLFHSQNNATFTEAAAKAVPALREHHSKEIYDVLVKLLNHEDLRVKEQSLNGLALLGKAVPEKYFNDIFETTLNSTNYAFDTFVRLMGALEINAEHAVAVYKKYESSSDAEIRLRSALVLSLVAPCLAFDEAYSIVISKFTSATDSSNEMFYLATALAAVRNNWGEKHFSMLMGAGVSDRINSHISSYNKLKLFMSDQF